MNTQLDSLEATVQRATEDAEAATERAVDAERSARVAATTRDQAEDDAEAAREQAANAVERATVANQRAAAADETSLAAQEAARLARERAEEIRRVAEAEMNRLTEALGRIADTRRTALGLVMSLDEGYLKFDFDRAELRPERREVLSRIAGILFAADDVLITGCPLTCSPWKAGASHNSSNRETPNRPTPRTVALSLAWSTRG